MTSTLAGSEINEELHHSSVPMHHGRFRLLLHLWYTYVSSVCHLLESEDRIPCTSSPKFCPRVELTFATSAVTMGPMAERKSGVSGGFSIPAGAPGHKTRRHDVPKVYSITHRISEGPHVHMCSVRPHVVNAWIVPAMSTIGESYVVDV